MSPSKPPGQDPEEPESYTERTPDMPQTAAEQDQDYQFPEDVKAEIDRLVELHLKIEGRNQDD